MNRFDRNLKYLGFNDTWVRILGVLFVGFWIPILFFDFNILEADWPRIRDKYMMTLLYTTMYWEVSRLVVILFRKWYPDSRQTKRRLSLQSIVLVFTTLLISLGTDFCIEGLLFGIEERPADIPTFLQGLKASFISLIIIISIYEGIYFFFQLRQSVTETERLKRANVQAQLDTLKNQVNPHFLFNSLNTLATIIPEDPELSVEFVQKLSKVYRHILEFKDRKIISLQDELDCLNAYMFLLKIRFGENFRMNIDVDHELLQRQVVPMSMQILLENAIKHNIISNQRPLQVDVFVEGNTRLIMRNNLQKKNQVIDSTQTGLQNIRDRYTLLTQQKVDVIVTDKFFMVSLPLIKLHQYEGVNY
ncbi:MAG: histidine kinase [Bacteroidota bacterium]